MFRDLPRPVLGLWIAVVVALVLGLASLAQRSQETRGGILVQPLLKTVPADLADLRGL